MICRCRNKLLDLLRDPDDRRARGLGQDEQGESIGRLREVSDLTDSLIRRAQSVVQLSDQLIATLEDAGRRIAGATVPGSSHPEATAHAGPGAGAPTQPLPEGALLLATEMANAGRSRDEIARRLRDEFGVIDATAILNQIEE
jgi:hypothetical protein